MDLDFSKLSDHDGTDGLNALPFKQALERAQGVVDGINRSDETRSSDLEQAMSYAVRGGKALRGFLVLEGARMHGIPISKAGPVAYAIECMHAYSLIHDDLPCMDDDDMRRGRPTVHKKWNEHTAVLAGDALQARAFEVLTHPVIQPADVSVRLIGRLGRDAGGSRIGMVGGQMLDIEAESKTGGHTLAEIEAVQNGKTGALIRWSCIAGPVLAQADEKALDLYGDKLGLAFQIADDVLDVEGDAEAVGKAVGKDEAAGKATFVSLLGLDGAKRRADSLVQEACDALSPYGDNAETLRDAARFVVNRTH